MTHRYLYIAAGSIIAPDSRFYEVWIGTTKQAQRDERFLEHYAARNGHYFHKYDHDVDVFLGHIKANTAPELSPSLLHNQHEMQFVLNLEYRISCNRRRR